MVHATFPPFCRLAMLLFFSLLGWGNRMYAQDTLTVNKTTDFVPDGSGSAAAWDAAEWITLTQLDSGVAGYTTRCKILYSGKGVYVLFHGMDKKITSTYFNDFGDLYQADVFEVFFHTDPQQPLYFEYEINAHDKELVLLIPNLGGKFYGWQPWHYQGERKVVHKIHIDSTGGEMRSWMAECFFPYALLNPLQPVPPARGDTWNANFCRLDYDTGAMIKWSWSPVQQSFHEYKSYRPVRFK